MDKAFFDLDGEFYVGRDPARGPWSPDLCHAGPVAGAIAREVEARVDPRKSLVRLTIDLIRPVPMAGFQVQTSLTREGKRTATCKAELVSRDGRICAMATSLSLAPQEMPAAPNPQMEVPHPDEASEGLFPLTKGRHRLPMFGNQIDIRYPPGEAGSTGPTRLWMRTPPLLSTEPTSPFQRICPLADCGNAISRNGELQDFDFVNADLTIHMHRPPIGDWLLSDSISFWQPNGMGQSESRIFDEQGPCAFATQSLVLAGTRT